MRKIEVRLEPIEECWMLFQVLYMDERFRSVGIGNTIRHQTRLEWQVRSSRLPALNISGRIINLQGIVAKSDKKPVIKSFNSELDRDAAIINIKNALADWAENWEGWKDESPAVEEGGYVYEF